MCYSVLSRFKSVLKLNQIKNYTSNLKIRNNYGENILVHITLSKYDINKNSNTSQTNSTFSNKNVMTILENSKHYPIYSSNYYQSWLSKAYL